MVERKQYKKVHKIAAQASSQSLIRKAQWINIQAVCPAVLSPE